MLILLAALLLSGPPAVRAEDSPAAAGPALDPADTNGDGVVSGKERRQKRRADRRARRGEKGPNGEVLSDEALDAAEAAEATARSSSAGGKASSAAAALKNSLPSADAGDMPGGEAGSGAEKATGGRKSDGVTSAAAVRSQTVPAGGSPAATDDPGNPKSPSDFALAARSGYAPAFAAAGLKLAPDGKSVLRLDGRPATAEDYARLQREIGAMPAALGRRPDFFSAVSPAHYADLKRGYKEKKEGDTVYKDVGTTAEDRDFVHTASCSKLSGECNKSAEKASYKKGDFVAPEDLDNMWDALQKELDGSAESGGLPSLGAARADISREKAIEAARALSPENSEQATGAAGDTKADKTAGAAVVSRALASVGKLWKRASALASPAANAANDGGAGAPLALGALVLAALGAGALFMRRKS